MLGVRDAPPIRRERLAKLRKTPLDVCPQGTSVGEELRATSAVIVLPLHGDHFVCRRPIRANMKSPI